MNRTNKFWFVLALWSAVPIGALVEGSSAMGSDPAPAPSPSTVPLPQTRILRTHARPLSPEEYSDDLTPTEMRSYIQYLKLEKQGESPNEKYVLHGMIPTACYQGSSSNVLLSNSASDPQNVRADGFVGFKLSDPYGELRRCIDKTHVRCTRHNCTSIVALGNTTMDASKLPKGSVGLLWSEDGDSEAAISLGEHFDVSHPLEHKDSLTIQAERAEKARLAIEAAAKKEKIRIAAEKKSLLSTVNYCTGSVDLLESARAALDKLCMFYPEDYDTDHCERISKRLNSKEVTLVVQDLSERAGSSTIEELTELRNELKTTADDYKSKMLENPERADQYRKIGDQLAMVYFKIARRYVDAKGATIGAWDEAAKTIAEGLTLPKLTTPIHTKLEQYANHDIPLNRMQKVASMGMSGNPLFSPYYFDAMNRFSAEAMQACNQSQMGQGVMNMGQSAVMPQMAGGMEACMNAMSALQSVRQMPQMAQQVDSFRNSLMSGINGQPNQGGAPGMPQGGPIVQNGNPGGNYIPNGGNPGAGGGLYGNNSWGGNSGGNPNGFNPGGFYTPLQGGFGRQM